MKQSFPVVLVLLSIFLQSFFLKCWAESSDTEPTVIAVIDSTLDTTHPLIAPYLYRCANCSPENQAIFDDLATLNEARSAAFLQSLQLTDQGDAIDRLNSLLDGLGRTDQPYKPTRSIPFFSTYEALKKTIDDEISGKRAKIATTSLLLHGTHVSGLAMAGLDPRHFKLLFIPVPGTVTDNAGDEQALEKSRGEIAIWFKLVTKALQLSNARTVNLSSGIFGHLKRMKAFKKTTRFMKKVPIDLVKTAATLLDSQIDAQNANFKAIHQLYSEFFSANSETLFIMAGGNFAEKTETMADWDITTINHLPHLIQVAATDYKGELASFSNRSADHIELAAPGVDILGARFGGKMVRMSGTSMAAPLTTRQAALIAAISPNASPQDIIAQLYRQASIRLPNLRAHVQEGRFLLPPGVTATDGFYKPHYTEQDWKLPVSECEVLLSK